MGGQPRHREDVASVNCRQWERSVVSARHFSYNDFHQRPRGRDKSRWSRRAAAPASTSAHLGPARPGRGRLLLGAFSRTRSARTWQK